MTNISNIGRNLTAAMGSLLFTALIVAGAAAPAHTAVHAPTAITASAIA
ncbi:hypothetical protein [Sphingomonas sp. Leaf17]|nr:hypothetical protein [Sphingomonas sp. Leaf17]